jgi:eukaryotic-like serine/threonine-protein kinase
MLSRSRMPYQTQLRADDPGRVGRYFLAGRIAGIPSDDPIYLATGPDGSEVALSVLTRNWARDGAARDRFAAEAAVAKRVPPFCAARVLDAGVDADIAYLVSEYVPGQSLMEVVTSDGVLRGPDLDAAAIGMATGLASVHQAGLVHGHFGPEYAIVPPSGPFRVVEFAITPPYGAATPSADMLAWAHAVFYVAAGRPPARAADLDLLPGHLRDLVERCVTPDPAERPTARAVVMTLIGDATPRAGVLAEGSRIASTLAVGRGAGRGAASRGPAGPASVPAAVPPAAHRPAGRTASVTGPRARPGQSASQRAPAPRRQGAADRSAGYTRDRQETSARPPHTGSHQQPRRRGRGILIGAAVVVVVLAGAAVLHLIQDSGKPRTTANDRTRSSLHSSPPPSPSGPPATTPAAFAGTWRGVIRQPPNDVFTVSVTLTSGAVGGSVSYVGDGNQLPSCSGSLSLTRATSSTLDMIQDITKGRCGSKTATVTIVRSGPGAIHFVFTSGQQLNKVTASGKLTKS